MQHWNEPSPLPASDFSLSVLRPGEGCALTHQHCSHQGTWAVFAEAHEGPSPRPAPVCRSSTVSCPAWSQLFTRCPDSPFHFPFLPGWSASVSLADHSSVSLRAVPRGACSASPSTATAECHVCSRHSYLQAASPPEPLLYLTTCWTSAGVLLCACACGCTGDGARPPVCSGCTLSPSLRSPPLGTSTGISNMRSRREPHSTFPCWPLRPSSSAYSASSPPAGGAAESFRSLFQPPCPRMLRLYSRHTNSLLPALGAAAPALSVPVAHLGEPCLFLTGSLRPASCLQPAVRWTHSVPSSHLTWRGRHVVVVAYRVVSTALLGCLPLAHPLWSLQVLQAAQACFRLPLGAHLPLPRVCPWPAPRALQVFLPARASGPTCPHTLQAHLSCTLQYSAAPSLQHRSRVRARALSRPSPVTDTVGSTDGAFVLLPAYSLGLGRGSPGQSLMNIC